MLRCFPDPPLSLQQPLPVRMWRLQTLEHEAEEPEPESQQPQPQFGSRGARAVVESLETPAPVLVMRTVRDLKTMRLALSSLGTTPESTPQPPTTSEQQLRPEILRHDGHVQEPIVVVELHVAVPSGGGEPSACSDASADQSRDAISNRAGSSYREGRAPAARGERIVASVMTVIKHDSYYSLRPPLQSGDVAPPQTFAAGARGAERRVIIGHVGDVETTLQMRRRGHCTEMLRQSVAVFRAAGFDMLVLETRGPTEAVYAKCGFVKVERRKGFRDTGRGLRLAGRMALPLSDVGRAIVNATVITQGQRDEEEGEEEE